MRNAPRPSRYPGFRPIKPMVFSGLYPADSADYDALRDAVEKLRLNDASFTYEPETSLALGFGFRCGFLGLLHMEIIQERLEREFALALITTAPTVAYRVVQTDGEAIVIDSPAKLPPPLQVDHIEEPYIRATIHLPTEFLGNVLQLCQDRRGEQTRAEDPRRDPRHADLRAAAGRGGARLLRQAEVAHQGATPRWTTSTSTSGPRTW